MFFGAILLASYTPGADLQVVQVMIGSTCSSCNPKYAELELRTYHLAASKHA